MLLIHRWILRGSHANDFASIRWNKFSRSCILRFKSTSIQKNIELNLKNFVVEFNINAFVCQINNF